MKSVPETRVDIHSAGEELDSLMVATLESGVEASFSLNARLARLLDILVTVWERGEGLHPSVRGWISRDGIIAEITERTRTPVTRETVTKYASLILKEFAEAVEKASPGARVPLLIERRRNVGMRLGPGVRVRRFAHGAEETP